ncbi:MAG: hypothetical protein H6550_15950 [Chitinophagales bacterium]|nr:hypothetical protein [Chitinophagales bacterium]
MSSPNFETYIFDEFFTDYDRRSDPNKDADDKGTQQRYMETVGKELDDNTIPLIEDMNDNVLMGKGQLSRIVPYSELDQGYLDNWEWFSGNTITFRRNVARIMDRLQRIACTVRCCELMFGWLGFGVTITSTFVEGGFDSMYTFDSPARDFDSGCPSCSDYSVAITGAAGSLTAGDITNITTILRFNQPINAAISAITYNGASVIDDFDTEDPTLNFNIYAIQDADVEAFVTETGITDTTTIKALDTMVLALKAASLWTKIKAMYPLLGSNAATAKYNLKDPRDLDVAYRITFYNSPPIDAYGVKWNGTTQYGDTYFVPSTGVTGGKNMHLCVVVNDDRSSYRAAMEMGAIGNGLNSQEMSASFNAPAPNNKAWYSMAGVGSTSVDVGSNNEQGLYVVSRNTTDAYMFRNGVQLHNITAAATTHAAVSTKIFLGAESNSAGTGVLYRSDLKHAFYSIGESLSTSEIPIFSSIINTFMATLGRYNY